MTSALPCPTCGHPSGPTAAFCRTCGSKLDHPQPTTPAPPKPGALQSVTCRHCGHINDTQVVRCLRCGNDIA